MSADCPSWCAGHDPAGSPGTEFTEDLMHSTEPAQVPVVSLLYREDGTRYLSAESLDLALFQYQLLARTHTMDREEEWVFIGQHSGGLTVTRESALRIYRALGKILSETSWNGL